MTQNPIDPDKEKQKIVKKLFSSLTARKTAFMYVGILPPNTKRYILANLDPDELIRHCEATLSMHILTIKKNNINKHIRELVKFLNLPDRPYIIKINDYISQLNKVKFKLEDLPEIKRDNSGIFYIPVKQKNGKIDKKVLAYPISIYTVIPFLKSIVDNVDARLRQDPFTPERIFYRNKNLISKLADRGTIDVELDISEYKNDNGVELFKYKPDQKELNIPLFEGLEIISLKEFMKKFANPETCKLQLHTWVLRGCIEYVTSYEDDDIHIFSTRPHNRVYLKRKKETIENG